MTAGGASEASPSRVIPYQEDERVDGTGTGDVTLDDVKMVPGSIEWLGEMGKVAMVSADEARRRFWKATDEVARLRRDLSQAEERLAAEEREYHASGTLMREIWGQLRSDIENAPSAPLPEPSR